MMNKEELEKMFDEKFDMGSNGELFYNGQLDEGTEYDYVKQFIFETIIPEVLKEIINVRLTKNHYEGGFTYCKASEAINEIKQKAISLYGIEL